MKNLENIPKKNIFEVPDGYFDKLPSVIQARVAERPSEQPSMRYVLNYALPVIVLVAVAIFIFRPGGESAEKMVNAISTEQLVAYLEEDSYTIEELLNDVDFDNATIEAIEQEAYFNFDIDMETINDLDLTEF